MSLFRPFAAGLSLLLLAGCQSSAMRDQTIAYNEAVADSTNQFFLLNVMRARDRFPVYYTRTTGNNASQSASAGVALEIDNWHVSPSAVAGGSASNTVSLANLDDQKFVRGVLTPVPLTTLGFYLDQGWPKEVMLSMFIEQIKIDKGFALDFARQFDTRCTGNAASNYCWARRPLKPADAAFCRINPDNCEGDRPVMESPSDVMRGCIAKTADQAVTFDNSPEDARDLECFHALLRVLIPLGLNVISFDKYTVITPDLPAASAHNLTGLGDATNAKLIVSRRDGGLYAVCSKIGASGFTLDKDVIAGNSDVMRTAASGFYDADSGTTSLISEPPQSCGKAADAQPHHAASGEPVFSFTTRSLDGMIYYVGEDVRAGEGVRIWSGHDGRQHEVPLFVVESNAAAELVSIDYRGGHYAIPDQCEGQGNCEQQHRSLQVLSLLNQVWGLQKEASEAPSAPVVSVINAQ